MLLQLTHISLELSGSMSVNDWYRSSGNTAQFLEVILYYKMRNYALKMRIYALNMRIYALNMRSYALQMRNYAFKMRNYAFKMRNYALKCGIMH